MGLMSQIKDEMELANRRILSTLMRTDGGSWRLAIETLGDEQERRVVGIEDSTGTMVMGDCMSDVNNEVTVADARFVAMFDPVILSAFRELFDLARREDVGSPFFLPAYRLAEKINKKWEEAEALLKGENA